MTIPDLSEFEKTLFEISQEVENALEVIYHDAVEKDNINEDGQMKDICAIGSTIMYLDGRKALYKFFSALNNKDGKFYSVFARDGDVRLSLNNVDFCQSYTLRNTTYEIVAKKLKELYGWEIYNDVRVD